MLTATLKDFDDFNTCCAEGNRRGVDLINHSWEIAQTSAHQHRFPAQTPKLKLYLPFI
jgi:hypothetical protein